MWIVLLDNAYGKPFSGCRLAASNGGADCTNEVPQKFAFRYVGTRKIEENRIFY